MGTAVVGQVEAAAEGPPFGIRRGEHHGAHPCLDQGAGAHRAGLQGHQQGAVVEAPGAQQGGGLPQRHQLSVAQGILAAVTAIAAPADSPAPGIQHHSRHGHLPQHTHPGGPTEQPLHPQPVPQPLPLLCLHPSVVAPPKGQTRAAAE